MAREVDVPVGGRVVRVREAGDDVGWPVVFFHGLADSRLDLRLGELLAQRIGVRLVSFDRPGYGASTPAAFGSASIARDVEIIGDWLDLDRFAVLGQSAGTRYALATAAVLGDRVTSIGCASGDAPLRAVPGSFDDFDDVIARLRAAAG